MKLRSVSIFSHLLILLSSCSPMNLASHISRRTVEKHNRKVAVPGKVYTSEKGDRIAEFDLSILNSNKATEENLGLFLQSAESVERIQMSSPCMGGDYRFDATLTSENLGLAETLNAVNCDLDQVLFLYIDEGQNELFVFVADNEGLIEGEGSVIIPESSSDISVTLTIQLRFIGAIDETCDDPLLDCAQPDESTIDREATVNVSYEDTEDALVSKELCSNEAVSNRKARETSLATTFNNEDCYDDFTKSNNCSAGHSEWKEIKQKNATCKTLAKGISLNQYYCQMLDKYKAIRKGYCTPVGESDATLEEPFGNWGDFCGYAELSLSFYEGHCSI